MSTTLPISNRTSSTMSSNERCQEVAKILMNGLIRLHGQGAVASQKQKPDALPKTVLAPNKPSNNYIDFLTEDDLARRWVCSTSRLQRWRSQGDEPAYLKMGRKVLYRLQDIQALEQSCQSARNASSASKTSG